MSQAVNPVKETYLHHPNGLSVLNQSPMMTKNPAAPGPVTNTENDSIDNDTWLEDCVT